MHVYQVSFRRRPLSSKMLMLDVADPKKSVGTSLSTVTKGDKEIGVSATQIPFSHISAAPLSKNTTLGWYD